MISTSAEEERFLRVGLTLPDPYTLWAVGLLQLRIRRLMLHINDDHCKHAELSDGARKTETTVSKAKGFPRSSDSSCDK